jgi:WD40 repeat protein
MCDFNSISDFQAHENRVWNISWSPDGKLIASCGEDRNIKIWNQRTSTGEWICRQILGDVHEKAIRRVAFSPNGKHLAACSFDATASIYERNLEGEFELIATIEGHENELKSIAWNPTGSLLATCSRDKTVWIWEMVDKEFDCVSVCPGHTQDVKNITWHPHKQMLFSVSYDDSIKIWTCDDENGNDEWNCIQTLSGQEAHQSTVWDLAFNSSGNLFCSVGDNCNEFFLWSFESNEPKRKQIIPSGHKRSIFSVAWSKTDIVATGSGDDSIRLFKVINGHLELITVKVKAHTNDVNCVAWNPVHSNILASCGDDGHIRVWNYNQTG